MNQLSLMTFTPDLKVCLSSVKRFLSRIRTHNFRASLGFEQRKPFDCHTAVSFFFSIVHQTFRSSDTKAWCKLKIIIIQHFESPSTLLASKSSCDQQKTGLSWLSENFLHRTCLLERKMVYRQHVRLSLWVLALNGLFCLSANGSRWSVKLSYSGNLESVILYSCVSEIWRKLTHITCSTAECKTTFIGCYMMFLAGYFEPILA